MNLDVVPELHGKIKVLQSYIGSWLSLNTLDPEKSIAVKQISHALGDPPDLAHRQIISPGSEGFTAHLLFFSSGVDDQLLTQGIISPLLKSPKSPQDLMLAPLSSLDSVTKATDALLDYKVVIGVEGWSDWYAADASKPPHRAIVEPSNAKVTHGPHEGFVEDLETNMILLRKYLRTPFVRIEKVTLGFWTHTAVWLVYLEGKTPTTVVRWVRHRLYKMPLQGLVDSSRIAMAMGGPVVIPSLQYSERPDQVAAGLLAGRAAILMNGTPSVLLAPARLSDLMTSPGDYYQLPVTASMTRLLRYGGLVVTTTLPALYVAALTVNPSFIPLPLYLTTIRTRLSIPFPAIIETILMLLVVDMVQEAGLIMPGVLGQTVTVFGTLILGDAAIKSGIVSAPTLITVTIAMLAQFLIPDANVSSLARLIRYALIPVAAIFGFAGIVSGWMMLLGMAVRVSTANAPYLSPLAPIRPGGWRDTLLRLPTNKRQASARNSS